MSNQRPGKMSGTKSGMDSDGINYRSLVDFAKSAAAALEKKGEEDAAFYFEQLFDYLSEDYVPSKGLDRAEKILGL